jgi:threonylcarbamoyladenosine tRNA methylthiotransferase MtaB
MKVYFDTIGCRLNQSEIERMANVFRATGHTIVDHAREADLVIINTCAVTAEAASDSRQKIRQAACLGNADIIVTGCWATLEPDIARGMPYVSEVVLNMDKRSIPKRYTGKSFPEMDLELLAREPLPSLHRRTRAFIKIQEGCDNCCTFCITRILRGKSSSLSEMEIIKDIDYAIRGGVKEIVLTGVNLAAWGRDLVSPWCLKNLIIDILNITSIKRLRLSSLENWDLGEGFLDLWSNPRLCRHIHLPLQSGCQHTLKRMVRKTCLASFAALVNHARSVIDHVAITTDIMVGFPGETDSEFEESLEFVRSQNFAGGHVFHFSPRPETAAANMPNQVQAITQKIRSDVMRKILADASVRFRESNMGLDGRVLWERADERDGSWRLQGLTDNNIRVMAESRCNLRNEISSIRMAGLTRTGMTAILLD